MWENISILDDGTDDVEMLVKAWHDEARWAQAVHYDSATLCSRWIYLIGIPVVVLATIGGSSQLANVSDEFWKNTFAAMTLLAAILAALQTFLNFSERGEQHRIAAVRFGGLKKEIEVFKRFFPGEEDKLHEQIEKMRIQFDEAERQSPNLSKRAWSKRRKFLFQTSPHDRNPGQSIAPDG